MKSLLLSLLIFAYSVCLARADDFGMRSSTVTAGLRDTLNKQPAQITAADLAGVTELKLPHVHIRSFNDNDFAGLTNLKKLHFYSVFHNKGRPQDPIAISDKVFANLSKLEELIITTDQLGLLPDDAFAGLTSLKILELNNVTLNRLPKSMLTLPKIEVVYYDGKGMSKEDYETLKEKLGDKLKPKRQK